MDDATKTFYRRSEAFIKTARIVNIIWMTVGLIPLAIFGGDTHLTVRWWALAGITQVILQLVGGASTQTYLDAKEKSS